MNICNNPYSIPPIDIDDCIGTSLVTINNNFEDLRQAVCDVSTEIESTTSEFHILSSEVTTLSGTSPGVAHSWVTFDGTTLPTPTVFTEYNIAGVTRVGEGVYTITFDNPFNHTLYCLIATCKRQGNITGYVWAQPSNFASGSVRINVREATGTTIDSEYISVVIFNK